MDQERDHEKIRIEQRFMEMNRQISELINLVNTLTEKVTSNPREDNGLRTLFSGVLPCRHCDRSPEPTTTHATNTPPKGTPRNEPPGPQRIEFTT